MPIYAYKCDSCGFAKDVLQKISDAPLSECPSCQAPSFRKQVTAAGFQLKGSGWYVTDFRGGNNNGSGSSSDAKSSDAGGAKSEGGDATSSGTSDAKAAGSSAGTKSAGESTTSKPTPAASTTGTGSGS